MRYEAFPSVGTKTNRLIIHSPEDECNDNYDTPFPKLEPVNGAIPPDQLKGDLKSILPPTSVQEFDACSDFPEFRRSSYRGRRRTHAYQLAAKFRKSNVHIFEKWFTTEAQEKFSKLLNLLNALVQGVRVNYMGSNDILYQVNAELDRKLMKELLLIRDRTIQLNLERNVDIPGLPEWSNDPLIPLYLCTFSANDWEILAATLKIEVETFLQICLYLGYDYKPVNISAPLENEDSEENEDEEDPKEEDTVPVTPRLLPDSVRSIIEESLQKGKSKARPAVHFSPPDTPTPIPSTSATHIPTSDIGRESLTKFVPQEPVVILKRPGSDSAQSSPTNLTPIEDQYPTTPATSGPISFNLPDQQSSIALDQTPVLTAEGYPTDNPFAPIDPVGKTTTVPSYQVEQVNRVYGAPPATPIYSLKENTGTERFNEMFRPSIYATHIPATSMMSSPGVVRAANSGRYSFASDYPYVASGGAYSYAPANSTPAPHEFNQSKDPGNISDLPDPSKPPNGLPNRNGGGYPSGPPSGGGFPGGPPNGGPPNGNPRGSPGHPNNNRGGSFPPGPPGPPGGNPPDPPSGGAVDPNSNNPRGHVQSGFNRWVNTRETHFDTKLKPDVVPTWDGEESTLGRWILQINELALRSESIYKGLGDVVPTRFRDKAAAWWYSLADTHRIMVSQNWDTLKDEIRTYWMNQAWIDRTQRRAIRASYRDSGHAHETPTEYFIRKYELLSLVYNFTPSQVMAEILLKAPRMWSTVLNPRSFNTLAQFQTAIKYHEELLIDFGNKYEGNNSRSNNQRSYKVGIRPTKKFSKDKNSKSVRTYSIGNNTQKTPPHPRDDSNVSKGKTPGDYGARGCIFCGSTRHWDRECKHNQGKALFKARTMFVEYEPDDIHAEAEYDRCYHESRDFANDDEDSDQDQSEQEESTENTERPNDSTESEESDF